LQLKTPPRTTTGLGRSGFKHVDALQASSGTYEAKKAHLAAAHSVLNQAKAKVLVHRPASAPVKHFTPRLLAHQPPVHTCRGGPQGGVGGGKGARRECVVG
jgi:hypothetical protein